MTTSAKRKGDNAELEAARALAALTGWPVRRKLGAGRQEDTGDLYGVPETTVQVKSYYDCARAIREGLPELRAQQANAQTPFAGLMVRRRGRLDPADRWAVVMTLEQFATLLREATGPCACTDPDFKIPRIPPKKVTMYRMMPIEEGA